MELRHRDITLSDAEFNTIYPRRIRNLSEKHWTPVAIAKAAAEYLVSFPGEKILDIGSGVGKFCLVGAANTAGHFTGVEQRKHLVELSTKLSWTHGFQNVKFIHGNITTVDFSDYDAFYFFNSFHENLDVDQKIDDTIGLNAKFYDHYSRYLVQQLSTLRTGTRLATYCTLSEVVPQSFRLVDSHFNDLLNFWEKET